jgi:hypothetical protein
MPSDTTSNFERISLSVTGGIASTISTEVATDRQLYLMRTKPKEMESNKATTLVCLTPDIKNGGIVSIAV